MVRATLPNGWVGHSELERDGFVVLLGRRTTPLSRASALPRWFVTDLTATCALLATTGGALLEAPADRPWGVRQAIVVDPGGQHWVLTQHMRRHRSRRVVRPSLRATTGVSGGWKDSTSWPSSTASTPTCVASKPGAHRHGTPGLGAAVVPATVTPSGAYVRAGASRRRFPNDHLRANGRRPLTRRRRVNGRNPQDCIGVRPPVLALIP